MCNLISVLLHAPPQPPLTFIVLYIIGRLSCGLQEENSGIGVAEVDE